MENNWQNYRKYFPVKYFQPGEFDQEVLKHLSEKSNLKVLDIGGGVYGTEVLKKVDCEVYLLDPYIKEAPQWMKGKLNWDHQEQFDLIIARGCINYLTPEELCKIPGWLKKGGLFMANTFINPPDTAWREKAVVNLSGESGVEKVRLKGKVVEHLLEFKNYQISHSFFYYSLTEYFDFFKVLGYRKYNHNSVILKVFN